MPSLLYKKTTYLVALILTRKYIATAPRTMLTSKKISAGIELSIA